MTALAELTTLIGRWQGANHLWLTPQESVRISESTAEISAIAHEQFTELRYTWADEGKPQQGWLVLGRAPKNAAIQAVWFDTWHMAHQFMVCAGNADDKGVVRIQGSYAAPPGPDWGWQITIEPQGKDAFRFLMHNITPEGEKFLAVEVAFSRQK